MYTRMADENNSPHMEVIMDDEMVRQLTLVYNDMKFEFDKDFPTGRKLNCEVKCSLCGRVPMRCYHSKTCKHLYCGVCTNGFSNNEVLVNKYRHKYPMCVNEDFNKPCYQKIEFIRDMEKEREVAHLKATCPYKKYNGCNKIKELHQMTTHMAECEKIVKSLLQQKKIKFRALASAKGLIARMMIVRPWPHTEEEGFLNHINLSTGNSTGNKSDENIYCVPRIYPKSNIRVTLVYNRRHRQLGLIIANRNPRERDVAYDCPSLKIGYLVYKLYKSRVSFKARAYSYYSNRDRNLLCNLRDAQENIRLPTMPYDPNVADKLLSETYYFKVVEKLIDEKVVTDATEVQYPCIIPEYYITKLSENNILKVFVTIQFPHCDFKVVNPKFEKGHFSWMLPFHESDRLKILQYPHFQSDYFYSKGGKYRFQIEFHLFNPSSFLWVKLLSGPYDDQALPPSFFISINYPKSYRFCYNAIFHDSNIKIMLPDSLIEAYFKVPVKINVYIREVSHS